MPKHDATDGEFLCTFIKRRMVGPQGWDGIRPSLEALGRLEFWSGFFEEVVATHLTGRLVMAGSDLADEMSGKEKGGKAMLDDPGFRRRHRDLLRETTQLGGAQRGIEQELLRLAIDAIRASYENVTATVEDIVRKEAGRNPRCFLCNNELVMVRGEAARALSDDERKRIVEWEHVWPRSYGGNSTPDNLLLACHDCNQRKANYANWAMVDVQAMILGRKPSEDDRKKISGQRRFALLSREAFRLADAEDLTLKQAHRRLRVEAIPYVVREVDVADFFNLANHRRD